MDVDGARLDVGVASPHEIEELRALEDAIRVAHEERQQLELPQAELDLLAVEEDLVGVEVDAQPSALEELVRGGVAPGRGRGAARP